MSALDKNKIFFGMVKYILSEQKNVDWVFKTSIMSYNGAKQSLTDTSSNDVMNNLIDFIYEMKPYHVQFSEFQSGYEPDMELCNVSCVDKSTLYSTIRFDNIDPVPSDEFRKAYKKYQEDPVQYPLSKDWLTTSLANRIAYTKVHYNKDMPTDEEFHNMTRSDFKGTVLTGSDFQSDIFGYDILNYDTDQYDSPTVIYDYCLRDMTEPENMRLAKFVYDPVDKKWKRSPGNYQTTPEYMYEKEIISVGETNFSISYDGELTKNDIQLLLYKNNTQNFMVVTDYSMVHSGVYQFEVFVDILDGDTLYIQILKNEKLDKEYVYNAMAFEEQDSDNIKRKIIPLTEQVVVDEPEPNIVSKRLLVIKQMVNGSRVPYENYTKFKGKLYAYGFKDKEHIILSAYDYKYLYDVIVKSSDVFGRSNNTIIYSGAGLLRPHYEADRPSELLVSHGIDTLITNDGKKITFVDFNGDVFYTGNAYISDIKVADVKKNSEDVIYAFSLDNSSNLPKKLPIDFFINGEIITATKLEDGFYTGLMRAKMGSHLNANTEDRTDFEIGSKVGVIRRLNKYEKLNNTISYQVKDPTVVSYYAPLGSKLSDEFDVQFLQVGQGVPEEVNNDELSFETDSIKVIGNVIEENNELHIYNDDELLLYVIRGKEPATKGTNVYEYHQGSPLKLIGVRHGDYIQNLHGETIATIKKMQMIGELVKVKFLNELSTGDVIHISVTKQ